MFSMGSNLPILYVLLTILASGAATMLLPSIVQKTDLNKVLKPNVVDIAVGILAAYTVIMIVSFVCMVLAWMSRIGNPWWM